MATGKDKDDEDQFDGVAEGVDNPIEDDAAKEQEDSKPKGGGKSRTDKTEQEDFDEEEGSGKKGKGSWK